MTACHDKPPAEAREIDFYFDFISPFGYFASLRIDELAARHAYGVRWNSMLIGVSVVKVMGMKPLLETPLKGPYILRDADRYARRHGLRLARGIAAPMADPRPAGKAYNWLTRQHPTRAREFAGRVFEAYWREGQDISVQQTLNQILAAMSLASSEVIAGIASDDASALLRASVDSSLQRGVFGSPFFIVGDEPFFGVEKMELLEEWLASGGW